MRLSKSWISEEFVDLSRVSNNKFLEVMTAAGHSIKASKPMDSNSISADDALFEVIIPNNRPDCNSVTGMAREVSAAFHLPMQHHEPTVRGDDTDSIYNWLDIDITADELCNRYTARMAHNIQIAPSPPWLCQRLIAGGVCPVNNIVDICNYVTLEYGQPVHVFDYRSFSFGSMIIREPEPGEAWISPNGSLHHLNTGMPVITNHSEIVCPVGIPLDEHHRIKNDTVTVVFCAGNFNTASIRNTVQALSLPADPFELFETNLDAMMTVPAVQRACELVELLGCGNVLDGIIDVINYVPEPRTLKLQPDVINHILNTNLREEEMVAYLKRLEIPVADRTVLLPSFRSDLMDLSDLAQEIQRLLQVPD